MKHSKIGLLIFLILSVSSLAMAAAPGGQSSARMTCGPVLNGDGDVVMRAGLVIECQTQALAPQYSIRGCEMISDAGRQPLQQLSQDINTAIFAYATGGRIVLNKQNFTATLTLADGSAADCQ